MIIKWKVQPAPTGPYASFHPRGWPMGYHPNGAAAVLLTCETEYVPLLVRTGRHEPITVRVAEWHSPEERKAKGGFTWRKLKGTCATLEEAKACAQAFYDRHRDFYKHATS